MELNKRWSREPSAGSKGEWWLSASPSKFDPNRVDPNRAYIGWPKSDGTRTLYVWTNMDRFEPWEPFLTSTNVRALKAIGRIEAARRLYESKLR